jgi:tRNA (cmo5U34)-methyltransferase
MKPVGKFFDEMVQDYEQKVLNVFPEYHDALSKVADYIPSAAQANAILELGCGTGNLTQYMLNRFPDARFELIDLSEESLEICKHRFGTKYKLAYHQKDFRDLDLSPLSFDLVVSSVSIHHLLDEEKKNLFSKLYRSLTPNGVFIYLDQCKGQTEEIYDKHLRKWKEQVFAMAAIQENWDMWMEHKDQYDHYASVLEQCTWLGDSGFSNVDILWRNYLWTIIYAEKT